jgi:hypothetical protein
MRAADAKAVLACDGPAAAAAGLLYLIHTNNCSKPALARLSGRFGLFFPLAFPRGADGGNITG